MGKTSESWETTPPGNTHEGDAEEFIRRVLACEQPHVPDELHNNHDYHEAIGRALARVLRKEQDEEAEKIVQALRDTLADPEAVHGILHSDTVHSAALSELIQLEELPHQRRERLLRFMRVFELSWDDVPQEVQEELRKSGPLPPMHEATQ